MTLTPSLVILCKESKGGNERRHWSRFNEGMANTADGQSISKSSWPPVLCIKTLLYKVYNKSIMYSLSQREYLYHDRLMQKELKIKYWIHSQGPSKAWQLFDRYFRADIGNAGKLNIGAALQRATSLCCRGCLQILTGFKGSGPWIIVFITPRRRGTRSMLILYMTL